MQVLLLAFVMISRHRSRDGDEKSSEVLTTSNLTKLTVACLPAYLWILAVSLLPHKEERFLYVVYAQVPQPELKPLKQSVPFRSLSAALCALDSWST